MLVEHAHGFSEFRIHEFSELMLEEHAHVFAELRVFRKSFFQKV